MFEEEGAQNVPSQWAARKVVQNSPDGIQLFGIRSIEFRNEEYLSAAHAGLMTT